MHHDIFTAEHREKIVRIARERGVRLVVLYGSVARGTNVVTSDIDIGVLGEGLLFHEDEAILGERFSEATGFPRIEVRGLHHVSPLFLRTVLEEGEVLYEDTPGRAEALSLYAWKLAAETKHLRDARYDKTRERIAAYVT